MATVALLEAPSSLDPAHAHTIVNAAPAFLKAQKAAFKLPYPANLLISNESQEKWISYENILVASLQTGDHKIAQECVQALTDRFGKLNEKVIIFRGMYEEAIAANDAELNKTLTTYDDVIKELPTMLGVRKRRVALLKSMGRTTDAIASLIEILDASPTDAEAWMELADLYQSQGALEKTVFCLEEVLLVVANAWNIHAKLGEVLYLSASRAEDAEKGQLLAESIRRFCRSVELGGEYLRGFYGLKQATASYLELSVQASKNSDTKLPSRQTAQKLNEFATAKLAELLRKSKSDDNGWNGFSEQELIAAQALLNSDATKPVR